VLNFFIIFYLYKRTVFDMDENTVQLKLDKLIKDLSKMTSLLVAFSGGVDSTFLLAVAHKIMGDKVTAATAVSTIYPSGELEEAFRFTREREIKHVRIESDIISHSEVAANNADRCYHCKKHICHALKEVAKEKRIAHIAMAANMDDLGDYRPGMKAAEEEGILSPLLDAELNKEEIRFLSKEMNLPSWNRQSMACLASRIPYGSPVTADKLIMIDKAEQFLSDMNFRQYRVRHHGAVARIEVSASDIEKFAGDSLRMRIVKLFRKIGFDHVALDLEGYVTGSLNRVLKDEGEDV